jgi:hypothetical protein
VVSRRVAGLSELRRVEAVESAVNAGAARLAALARMVALVVLVTLPSGALPAGAMPLSKPEVLRLLGKGVRQERVVEVVKELGIDFKVTSDVLTELTAAGAGAALIAELMSLRPDDPPVVERPPAAPPAPAPAALPPTTGEPAGVSLVIPPADAASAPPPPVTTPSATPAATAGAASREAGAEAPSAVLPPPEPPPVPPDPPARPPQVVMPVIPPPPPVPPPSAPPLIASVAPPSAPAPAPAVAPAEAEVTRTAPPAAAPSAASPGPAAGGDPAPAPAAPVPARAPVAPPSAPPPPPPPAPPPAAPERDRREELKPLLEKARALAVDGDLRGAQDVVAKALELDPGEPEAWKVFKGIEHDILVRAEGFLLDGQIRRALREFQTIITKNPDSGPGHAGMGLALLQLKSYDEAVTALERALALDPGNARYRQSLTRARDLQKASRALERTGQENIQRMLGDQPGKKREP